MAADDAERVARIRRERELLIAWLLRRARVRLAVDAGQLPLASGIRFGA